MAIAGARDIEPQREIGSALERTMLLRGSKVVPRRAIVALGESRQPAAIEEPRIRRPNGKSLCELRLCRCIASQIAVGTGAPFHDRNVVRVQPDRSVKVGQAQVSLSL